MASRKVLYKIKEAHKNDSQLMSRRNSLSTTEPIIDWEK